MKKDEKNSRQNQHKNGIMNIERWYECPHCGKALFRVAADASVRGLKCKCKACKHIIEVNI